MEPPFQPPHLRRASGDLLPPKGPASSWDAVLARAKARDFVPLGPILERELPGLEKAASLGVPRCFRHGVLARDVVHDTLVKFLEAPEFFPAAGEARFVYYLQVAVQNRAVDEVRRLRALKRGAGRTLSLESREGFFDVEDRRQENPAAAAERAETEAKILDLIYLLRGEDRELMTWWRGGYSVPELARCWGISVDAMRKSLARCAGRLRELARERGLLDD